MKTTLLVFLSCCAACAGRPIGPPDPSHPGGSDTPTTSQIDPAARFFWAEAAGFAGTGEAVEVLGSGVVHGWNTGGDPTTRSPDYTGQVGDAADLFARFAAVDLSALPHGSDDAECTSSGVVTDCADCEAQKLDYAVASQVLPELAQVWQWFTDHPALAMYSPGGYCTF
jgi:hypothetical protein